MIRVLAAAAVLAAACSPPAPAPVTLPAPSPPPVPVDAAVASAPPPADAAAAAAPEPPPPPAAVGMISDDDCVKQGGHIETVMHYGHGPAPSKLPPTRVCRVTSPMNGHDCRDESDCQGGRCFCTGALNRPNPGDDPKLQARDGTAGKGVCLEQSLPPGEWFCLVVDGKIHLQGIIID